MRKLYHFPTSPYSRRARLALAHKGLSADLLDARANPALKEEARKIAPLATVPVLVETDGRILGDSIAIVHYLDRAYTDAPPIWPSTKDEAHLAFDTAALVDGALTTLTELGNTYHPLHDSPQWNAVKTERLARAQGALDFLGERVARLSRTTIAASGWGGGDIWLYSMIAWLEGLPARASTYAPAAQLVALGWMVPRALTTWADAHRTRDDVRALDA